MMFNTRDLFPLHKVFMKLSSCTILLLCELYKLANYYVYINIVRIPNQPHIYIRMNLVKGNIFK